MRGHKMPESHDMHPNVTPLIDIVMCLIIFYMLVAKIGINTGAMKEITLPSSFQGVEIKDLGNTVTLNVLERGPGIDEPMVTTLNPETGQLVELRLLEGGKKPLRDFLKLVRGDNPEFKVILRGDEQLNYKLLEPVLITCAEAQVKNVNFATRKPS